MNNPKLLRNLNSEKLRHTKLEISQKQLRDQSRKKKSLLFTVNVYNAWKLRRNYVGIIQLRLTETYDVAQLLRSSYVKKSQLFTSREYSIWATKNYVGILQLRHIETYDVAQLLQSSYVKSPHYLQQENTAYGLRKTTQEFYTITNLRHTK